LKVGGGGPTQRRPGPYGVKPREEKRGATLFTRRVEEDCAYKRVSSLVNNRVLSPVKEGESHDGCGSLAGVGKEREVKRRWIRYEGRFSLPLELMKRGGEFFPPRQGGEVGEEGPSPLPLFVSMREMRTMVPSLSLLPTKEVRLWEGCTRGKPYSRGSFLPYGEETGVSAHLNMGDNGRLR